MRVCDWVSGGLVLCFALLGGCGTSAKLERMRPAYHNLGDATRFTVVQATGRRSLREDILAEMKRQLRATGWWRYDERLDEGRRVDVRGSHAETGGLRAEPGEVLVLVDAYDSDVRVDVDEVIAADHATVVVVHNLHANVSFGVTVIDETGRTLLVEEEFRGDAEGEGDVHRYAVLRAAIAEAVDDMVDAITPRRVREKIKFDKDEDDMEPIADLVKDGAYAEAEKDLARMRREYPDRADVAYNLAVVKDAMGRYEEALELYDQAMRLGHEDYYAKSRAACARRLADERELQGRER